MISSNLECKWIIMLPRQKRSTDFYLQVPQAGSWWLERPHQLLLTSRPRSAPPERERKKNGLIRISLQSYHPKFAPPSSCAGTSDFQAGEKIWHLNPTTALVCLSYISNEKSDLRATKRLSSITITMLNPMKTKTPNTQPTQVFQHNPEAIHIFFSRKKIIAPPLCKATRHCTTTLHFVTSRYGIRVI